MLAKAFQRLKSPSHHFPKKKIDAYLNSLQEKVEKLKKLQEEQLKDLEELKKSILEKAFSDEWIK